VLIWFMLMFAAFNTLSACAPNFPTLMLCRFLAGLPHGAFFGVGAVVAMRLAREGQSASAVATMFAGLTVASVIGVPLGTWLGHNVSWRLVFLIVAAIGLATAASLKKLLPFFEAPQRGSFREDLRIFRRPGLWLAIAITSIGTGGFFAYLSYITPLLTETTGFSPDTIPLVMTVVGLGMTAGVLLGGKLADRLAPAPALLTLMLSMAALLFMNGVMIHSQAAMLVLAFATGANALALGPSIQMLLIENSKEAEMLGSSLGQSSFNIGNAIGAFLGGLPLTLGYSYVAPQWVACCLALCGAALVTLVLASARPLTRYEVR
jgi:DHA1 family arabinose polymer transporter-like MFS transporter